jgi:hypothetical protein
VDKDATDRLITGSLAMAGVILLVTAVGIFVVWRMVFKRVRGVGGGGLGGGARRVAAGDPAATNLQQNGRKARAKIVQIRPTGMVMNNINMQCEVTFLLEPLDGGPQSQISKVMMFNQTQMPRIGDVWPSWIDRADPSIVGVGQPSGASVDQIPLFREFGIAHPLDPTTVNGPAPAAGFAAPPSPGAPAPALDRLQQLERLVALRDSGALTELEFAAEKARLLGS